MNPVNTTWRIVFAIAALIFDAAVIWWTLIEAKADNPLAASAQWWAWWTGIVILAGLGVGAVTPQVLDLLGTALAGKGKAP